MKEPISKGRANKQKSRKWKKPKAVRVKSPAVGRGTPKGAGP